MDMHPHVPGEREPPLYFAGRKDELNAFDAKLRRLCASADPSGGLQLTVGVPGIGKTQLALQFATRVDGSVVLGRKVATLRLSPEALDSPVDLFKAMAFALDEREQGDQIAQHHDRVSGATTGVLGARGALAIDIVRHAPDLPGLLRESLRANMWRDRTLVVMIDELQRIGARGMSALCVLHDGVHGCPILLMGFGLQHTERTLANPLGGNGISRLATPATLTTLNHNDTLDAFTGNLSLLGHDDIPTASVEALANASFGFPQHINGYLQAAHKALLRHGHLIGASLASALNHGAERRAVYYNKRLAAGNSHAPMLALSSALQAANAASMSYDEAQAALKSAGFDAQRLDTAIERGAVVHDDNDNVSFGIPSFHSHMATLRDRAHGRRATRASNAEG